MIIPKIRCGDTVLHRPTGEEWLVAYADYETGALAWSGWPERQARIEDCYVVRYATDEEHAAHVAEWISSTNGGHRKSAVERLYARHLETGHDRH